MPKQTSKNKDVVVSVEAIQKKIYLIRSCKVMFDRDLAELYGVTTYNLNKAVKRNIERFPEDFGFYLTDKERKDLIFQFGISSWGGSRKPPYVFTEQGVAMLSGVLHSPRAVQVNIQIMRTFTKLRELMLSHKGLAKKIEELECKFEDHDKKIIMIFDAIKQLLKAKDHPPTLDYKRTKIGFIVDP